MPQFIQKLPKASIGIFLIALAVAIALPFLLFVVILLDQLENKERETLDRRTAREAQALATSVSRQLNDMTITLRLLASASELASDELRAFHSRTQAALQSGTFHLLVVRRDGQQLMNTRVPYGSAGEKTSNIDALRSVLRSGRIEVSGVFLGSVSEKWVFNVIMPLEEGLPSEAAALILTQNVEDLGRLVQTKGLPPDWSAALVDGSGLVIASSAGTLPGEAFPQTLLSKVEGLSGTAELNLDGSRNLVGYARLPGWSWSSIVWGPLETAQASISATRRQLIIGGLAVLVLVIALAFFVGRLLRDSIVQIAQMAERMGRGEIVSPIDTPVAEAHMVAMAMSEASFDRSEAENRLHIVLRELAHRTKNMLSVIQAMMRQTARQSVSVAEFRSTILERMQGLSRTIDLLIADNWSGVPVATLVRRHVDPFIEIDARLVMKGDHVLVKPEAVQTLGMAIHELATNAVKYGALSVPQGTVSVDWYLESSDAVENRFVMNWTETGGPPVLSPGEAGFGTSVIQNHLESAFRAEVSLEFPREGLQWSMKASAETLLKQA